MTSVSTSSSLIRQAQANEPEAWGRLSRLYTPLVYAWCKRAGLQSADVADVVQTVFLKTCKGLERFKKDSAQSTFRGWLWTITRNEITEHFRQLQDKPQAVGGTDARHIFEQLPDMLADETAPEELTAELYRIREALRMLEPEFELTTWQAFLRTAVRNQAAAEVAEDLGMTRGAVRQAKYRVIVRLREFLADD